MIEESFTDKSKTFYFTFGVDSQLADRYVKIYAPSELAARYVMVQHFATRWANFFGETGWARSPYTYKYSLLVTFVANASHEKLAAESSDW